MNDKQIEKAIDMLIEREDSSLSNKEMRFLKRLVSSKGGFLNSQYEKEVWDPASLRKKGYIKDKYIDPDPNYRVNNSKEYYQLSLKGMQMLANHPDPAFKGIRKPEDVHDAMYKDKWFIDDEEEDSIEFDKVYGILADNFLMIPLYDSWERNRDTRSDILQEIKSRSVEYLDEYTKDWIEDKSEVSEHLDAIKTLEADLGMLYNRLLPLFADISDDEQNDEPQLSYGSGS